MVPKGWRSGHGNYKDLPHNDENDAVTIFTVVVFFQLPYFNIVETTLDLKSEDPGFKFWSSDSKCAIYLDMSL